jgi:ABC-type transport system involved in cytochrome c biogenesis permease subunit
MKDLSRWLPWFVVVLAAFYLIAVMIPPKDEDKQPKRYAFAEVPILDGGRARPIDTSARSLLMTVAHKQTFIEEDKDHNARTQPAVQMVLDMMSMGLMEHYRISYIDSPELLALLELKPEHGQGNRYLDSEFSERLEKQKDAVKKASDTPEKERSALQNALLDLALRYYTHKLVLQHMENGLKKRPLITEAKIFRIENDEVLGLLKLEDRFGLRYSLAEIAANKKNLERIRQGARNAKAAEKKGTTPELVDVKMRELDQQVDVYRALTSLAGIPLVPAAVPGEPWDTLHIALWRAEEAGTEPVPAAAALEKMLVANATGDAETFNKELEAYRTEALAGVGGERSWPATEVFFNNFAPFYQCAILYIVVFLLVCGSWLGFTEPLRRAALWLTVFTVSLHTVALFGRILMTGRPPVTNLYTSAVFIGWGAVLLALLLEAIYKNSLGLVVGAVAGAVTGIIAHHLATGDTMEVLVAVLDTNFWLATHVVAITLGYTATYVAGLLGIIFIMRGVFTRSMSKGDFKTIGQMIYGVLCFATLLSFVGTVLGGIWADQSWGRFWGWDAKENGALMIVLWNALILHARWAGLVQQRGMAVLSLGGNIVTTWSWFAVNMLGVGLHSYGKMDQAVFWLWTFVISQVILIGIGLIPLDRWRSFQTEDIEPPAPSKEGRKPRAIPAMAGSTGITN